MSHTPITLAEAATRLAQPVRTVERMIRDGLLPMYGRGKHRMTFAESVEALLAELADGTVIWPPSARNKVAASRAAGVSTRISTGAGGRHLRSTTATPAVEPLVGKPPKRPWLTSTVEPLVDKPPNRPWLTSKK
jgi:excisionase family DNA binding protein